MKSDDWRIIKAMPLFDTMPDEAVRQIIGNREPRTHPKGALLFQQGQEAEAFYAILDGWVKIYRVTPEGEEAVIGVFSRGESFAEAAMFLGGRYPASAQVVTPARLMRIEGTVLRKKIHEDPGLALNMLASASKHLKALVEDIEIIKVLPGPRRVAEFLVNLAAQREGRCVVGLPYEKSLIAKRLGMKPESFSRAFAKLKQLGVVVRREWIEIPDIGALAEYVRSGDIRPARLGMASLQGCAS